MIIIDTESHFPNASTLKLSMSVKLQTTSRADPAIIIVTFLLVSKFRDINVSQWCRKVGALQSPLCFSHLLPHPLYISHLIPSKYLFRTAEFHNDPRDSLVISPEPEPAVVRHQTARAGQLITRAAGRCRQSVWIGDPGAANFPLSHYF